MNSALYNLLKKGKATKYNYHKRRCNTYKIPIGVVGENGNDPCALPKSLHVEDNTHRTCHAACWVTVGRFAERMRR